MDATSRALRVTLFAVATVAMSCAATQNKCRQRAAPFAETSATPGSAASAGPAASIATAPARSLPVASAASGSVAAPPAPAPSDAPAPSSRDPFAAAPPAAPAAPVPDDRPAAAPLTDPDGRPLPQTDAKPSIDSPHFRSLAEALWRAVLADDAELARPYFFPVSAYERVKDIPKPAVDWRARLWKAFVRNVHEYHRLLGARRAEARFVGVDLDPARARWMKPGSEGNKLGYWRVLHSRLRYITPEGKRASLELTSLISWRGEWYVVHLDGFK